MTRQTKVKDKLESQIASLQTIIEYQNQLCYAIKRNDKQDIQIRHEVVQHLVDCYYQDYEIILAVEL